MTRPTSSRAATTGMTIAVIASMNDAPSSAVLRTGAARPPVTVLAATRAVAFAMCTTRAIAMPETTGTQALSVKNAAGSSTAIV